MSKNGVVGLLALLLMLTVTFARPAAERPRTHATLSPRGMRLVGAWKLDPTEGEAPKNDRFVFRKDGTGTWDIAGLRRQFEWDLFDDKLVLVDTANFGTQTLKVTAVTSSRLVLQERPWHYRRTRRR